MNNLYVFFHRTISSTEHVRNMHEKVAFSRGTIFLRRFSHNKTSVLDEFKLYSIAVLIMCIRSRAREKGLFEGS